VVRGTMRNRPSDQAEWVRKGREVQVRDPVYSTFEGSKGEKNKWGKKVAFF